MPDYPSNISRAQFALIQPDLENFRKHTRPRRYDLYDVFNLELVQHVMVDGGYTGNDFADQVKLILNAKTTVAKRNELHTFTVLPQRWIIERSWRWLDKCRRLWKNCERALNSSLQMVVLAFLKIVLKRY
ncbi:transposase [Lactobacillus rhamnosus]|nr:transposase [Lacticaseibacillus rhamnosus]RND43154.1 Transposase DDE domain protein [Lacticaseibacillus paracasei]RND65063.1 Transposase DDE domain protein [Lacticaseibacillus paracasei]